MIVLDTALEDLKQDMLDDWDENRPGSELCHFSNPIPPEFEEIEGVRLRFDWELSHVFDAEIENDKKSIATMILNNSKIDFKDLIVNGDTVKHAMDPLLKSIDGEVKRGQKAVEVFFQGAVLVKEFKPKKKTTEYTLFTNMRVKFE